MGSLLKYQPVGIGAELHLLEARDLYDAALAPDHFKRALPRLTLTSVRLDRGDFGAAERVAREAAEILAASLPPSSFVRATADCRLGRALAGQGRRDEARALLEASVETLATTSQRSVRYQIECRRALAELYRDLGLEELARPHRAAVRIHRGQTVIHHSICIVEIDISLRGVHSRDDEQLVLAAAEIVCINHMDRKPDSILTGGFSHRRDRLDRVTIPAAPLRRVRCHAESDHPFFRTFPPFDQLIPQAIILVLGQRIEMLIELVHDRRQLARCDIPYHESSLTFQMVHIFE